MLQQILVSLVYLVEILKVVIKSLEIQIVLFELSYQIDVELGKFEFSSIFLGVDPLRHDDYLSEALDVIGGLFSLSFILVYIVGDLKFLQPANLLS